MTQSNEDLEAIYGLAAPYSEHKRGEHITYTSAEGERRSGEIIWVQAATDAIPMKYIVAPDDGGFLDLVMPGDVITQGEEQELTMQACPYCFGKHYDVEACPLNPNRHPTGNK